MSRALSFADLPPELQRQLGASVRGAAGRRDDPEHREQAALVAWARDPRTLLVYPELEDLYAVPNFNRMGKRWGAYFNAEGRKKGMCDLGLPHARGGYIGLFIEMKAGANRPTLEQRAVHARLRAAGHRVEVCYSADAAKAVLVDYLNAPAGRKETRCPTSST